MILVLATNPDLVNFKTSEGVGVTFKSPKAGRILVSRKPNNDTKTMLVKFKRGENITVSGSNRSRWYRFKTETASGWVYNENAAYDLPVYLNKDNNWVWAV